jgi:DNA-damage-inducible protein D
MSEEITPVSPSQYEAYVARLDATKRTTSKGTEYWMARHLMEPLGYADWRNFQAAIERARKAAEGAGENPDHHIGATTTLMEVGKGARREAADYFLTRYACYLLAMNADPSKTEVAFAQTYFAVQTRRQEIEDSRSEDEKRLEVRKRVSDGNRKLSKVAYGAGVRKFGVFHDAGQKAMYGGLSGAEVKAIKQIPVNDNLLDRIGRAELAMHEFRIVLTEQKIVNEGIAGEEPAIHAHRQVGQKVRRTVQEEGGTLPERLAAAPPIKQIAAQQRKALKGKSKGKQG